MNSEKDPTNETIDTRYAAALIRLLVERGCEVARVLAHVDVDFNPLDLHAPDYRAEISAEQYSLLYQQVLELLQDPGFGGSHRRMVTPGAFRMMCYAIIHCDTLGSALHRASHFFRVFFDVAVRLAIQVDDNRVVVGYCRSGEGASEQTLLEPTTLMEAYALAVWHRFCIWLTGRPLPLQRVQLQGQQVEQESHERLFACPVRYGQAITAMVFDAALLERSLVQTEHSLKEFLKTAPYQLMATPVARESNLVSQVQGMIGRDLRRGFPGFERVAEGLNMSAPTLRRRLKREGVTYQALKDECRRDAAMAYLNRPDLSISAVAVLMGFTEPSAFHRSFKKWTGMPPGEYRRRLAADLGQADTSDVASEIAN